LGVRFQQMAIWPIVKAHVAIRQQVLRLRPLDKLLDCLINVLAGGTGLIEIYTRGRPACAEQSTVSETLNACTPDNVAQMRTAIKLILPRHAQCYRHNYQWPNPRDCARISA
jgi:hypothetical protein